MALQYQWVQWNAFKKDYDRVLAAGMLGYLLLFAAVTLVLHPQTSIETLIIRAFGTLALLTLHVILAIGPLCRLNRRFLPLLYNRRHLGVAMFLSAAVHGGTALYQFHALGVVSPIRALFTSNLDYLSLRDFPFQVLGFLALAILFAMAATSHDFYLKNLGPRVWKSLHMGVYAAYVLILLHVFLGAFQQEGTPVTAGALAGGCLLLCTLHLLGAYRNAREWKQHAREEAGWVRVCRPRDIRANRARIVHAGSEHIALFKYGNAISAVRNQCKHQGGPLGEGKIVDGCITCPWHGYQYRPQDGQSPPPFKDRIATYRTKYQEGFVYVNPEPLPEGTPVAPTKLYEHE